MILSKDTTITQKPVIPPTRNTLTLKASGTGYDFNFYHNDHLATPQKLTNSAGAVSWAMESNAFGETIIKTQTTKNNLRFPGQYYDADIKLAQNYYRDYAPNLGRYVERDPIGLTGGVNNFIYSKQIPINNADILGLISEKEVCDNLDCMTKVSTCEIEFAKCGNPYTATGIGCTLLCAGTAALSTPVTLVGAAFVFGGCETICVAITYITIDSCLDKQCKCLGACGTASGFCSDK